MVVDAPPMNVLLLGATGFIGTAVLRHLLDAGHAVTAVGRGLDAARRQWPEVSWRQADIATLATPAAWDPLLTGIDAVVNCAGALQDGARDDVAAVQSTAPRALFAACAARGIGRIVQVSAVGAGTAAPTRFMRTKGEADAALAELTGGWVIFRPGLVIGPQAYGGTALLRAIAATPFVIPVVRGDAVLQTVHVDDVARAVLDAVEGRVPPRAAYDLVEEESRRLDDVLRALRAWLGLPEARVLCVPEWMARPAFLLGDALGRLGWRSPLRSAAWAEIGRGVTGDPAAWNAVTGRPVRELHATLRAIPVTVQERWFARMWPMKAVAIGTLSAFWLASGVIGAFRFEAAMAVLTTRGMAGWVAAIAVAMGSLIDIALGAGILVRRWMRAAALGMVAVTLGYLAGASLFAPDLWLDPLGPMVKTIPAAVLALVVLAVAEER